MLRRKLFALLAIVGIGLMFSCTSSEIDDLPVPPDDPDVLPDVPDGTIGARDPVPGDTLAVSSSTARFVTGGNATPCGADAFIALQFTAPVVNDLVNGSIVPRRINGDQVRYRIAEVRKSADLADLIYDFSDPALNVQPERFGRIGFPCPGGLATTDQPVRPISSVAGLFQGDYYPPDFVSEPVQVTLVFFAPGASPTAKLVNEASEFVLATAVVELLPSAQSGGAGCRPQDQVLITSNLEDQGAALGDNVQFQVTAQSSVAAGALVFTWQRNVGTGFQAIVNTPPHIIITAQPAVVSADNSSQTQTSTLTINSVEPGDLATPGTYRVLVGNNCSQSPASSREAKINNRTPAVVAVEVSGPRSVDVTFSDAMDNSARVSANYVLSGSGKGTLLANPDSADLAVGNQYRLTWNQGEMFIGGDITITVNGAQNLSGNAVSPPTNSGTDVGGAVGTRPTLVSVLVVDSTTVDVTFNKAIATGVTTTANYTLSGPGKGSLTEHPDTVAELGGNVYRLHWNSGEMLDSGVVTITVTNVADAAGNVIGAPNSGSGTSLGTDPVVNAVNVVDGLSVDVTFSEAMSASAATAGNYTVSGTGKGTLTSNPDNVVPQSSNVYRLVWNTGEMFIGGNITITVTDAMDLAGNLIGLPNSATDISGGIGVAPTVTGVSVFDAFNVDITFSEAMGTGVTMATNYTVSGTGKGTLTANPDSVSLQTGNTYRLTWNAGEMFTGGSITITAVNVKDLAGNTIGAPNTGTAVGTAVGDPPTVTTVNVVDGQHVDVTFSEAVSSGANVPGNYTVSGSGAGTLTPSPNSVAPQSATTYRLAWNTGEMLTGGDITITVLGVQDIAGNTIGAGNSATDAGAAVGTAPTLASVSVHNARQVDVTFTEAGGFSGTSVLTPANYTVSGTGKGTLTNNPNSVALLSGLSYRLTWTAGNMSPGGDITITATGVQDAAGNPMGLPNSQTDVGGAVGLAPTVSGITVVDARHVDVVFNAASGAMGAGATSAANYTISGTGIGTLAPNPDTVTLQGGATYRLTWNSGEMAGGGNVTITVNTTVQDSLGNFLGSPNTGSGVAVGSAPTVDSVSVVDTRHVDVTFSEAMGSGATTANRYAISGSGIGTLTANPNSVALQAGSTYRLTWNAGEMLNGGDITITVTNVRDLANNLIGSPNAGTDTGGAVGTPPVVESVNVVDGTHVDVVFTEAGGFGAGSGVTTAANYTVSGIGQGSLAANPDSVALQAGTTYRLTWNTGEMLNGGDVTITVTGVQDAAGNPIGAPNAGTDAAAGVGVAPTVNSATRIDATRIDVVFSEPMNEASVENLAAYEVAGGVNVTAAVLQGDGTTVQLSVDADPETQSLTVQTSVTDLAGNALAVPFESGGL